MSELESLLLAQWSSVVGASGIEATRLTVTAADEGSFGNGEASFEWEGLIVHLTRDRGQDSVDLAAAHAPAERFRLEDVELALGWSVLEELLNRAEPRTLSAQLADVVKHRDELRPALSIESLAATRASIERAAAQRGSAYVEKLQSLLPK